MNPWSFFFIGYVFSQPLFYNIAAAFLYYTRTDVRFAKEIFFFMTIECSQRVYSIVWFPIFFEQSFRNLIYYHL